MANEGLEFVEVLRKSPRFQLIRREIERLAPEGVYRFVGSCESPSPTVWQATRRELESHFAQAMSSDSYKGPRGQYDFQSSLPNRFRAQATRSSIEP